jgi:adenosylcobinamide-GDP ribazoletransferase
MTSFLLALQFLTRYPVRVPLDGELDARALGRSTRFFPLVGLLLGADLLFLRWVLDWVGILQPWPLAAAGLLLLYWAWVCDSLHLDGLSDTADGLGSGRSGEDMLAVMHDPRSGAFGVQATVVALLLKFALLASLPLGLWWALPLPLVFSRLLASLLCQARPYAGRPGSLSAWFIEGSQADDAAAAVGWSFFGFGLLSAVAVLTGLADARACGIALGVCVGALALGWALTLGPRRRLGGISGDFIGYAMQGCEAAALLGLLVALA